MLLGLPRAMEASRLLARRSFLETLNEDNREAFRDVISESRTVAEVIVKCNLLLVVSRARRFQGRGMDLPDLIQEGNMGLATAVDKYDLERARGRGVKGNFIAFGTYAVYWIDQRIGRAIQDKGRIVRLPAAVYDALAVVQRVRNQYLLKNGKEPTWDEVKNVINNQSPNQAKYLASVRLVLDSGADRTPQSLEKENEGTTLYDTVPDGEDSIEDQSARDTYQEMLIEAFRGLSSRERTILCNRFGLGNNAEQSLEDIGRQLWLTRERVRQIQDKALEKLRGNEKLCLWLKAREG